MINKSSLIPEKGPKRVDNQTWNEYTSEEYKWELWDGIPFSKNIVERDRLAICLIYSMGLEHLVNILPKYSKDELIHLLESYSSNT